MVVGNVGASISLLLTVYGYSAPSAALKMMNNMKDVENTMAMIALRVFGDDDDGQVLLEIASCRDCDHSLIWLLKIFQRTNKYNLAGVQPL